MSEFSLFLSKKLEESGMKQADVARATGYSTGKLSLVFSGKTKDPQFSTVLSICNALDIPIDEAASIYMEGMER